MQRIIEILTECNNDTTLARVICKVFEVEGYKCKPSHEGGKGEIFNSVKKKAESVGSQEDIALVVLIDEDYEESWPNRYRTIVRSAENLDQISMRSAKIYKDDSFKAVFLIFVRRLEDWLRDNCEACRNIPVKRLKDDKRKFSQCLDECKELPVKIASAIRRHIG